MKLIGSGYMMSEINARIRDNADGTISCGVSISMTLDSATDEGVNSILNQLNTKNKIYVYSDTETDLELLQKIYDRFNESRPQLGAAIMAEILGEKK